MRHLFFVNTFNYDKRFEMFYIFMPFLIVCMLLLPGCTVVNWGKKNMYQGIDLPYDSHGVLSYIRSIKLYDQFSSLASFDVMWLADAVRLSYVDLYIKTAGKRDEQKAHLLRLQQDELKHFISFYVLVPQELLLTQPQSLWHIFLKIDELTFDPIDIKPVELNVIYKSFFGKLYNRFKNVYQIKFEARDIYDNPIISENSKKLELHFRNIHKEVLVAWDVVALADHALIGQASTTAAIETVLKEQSKSEGKRFRKRKKPKL